MTQCATSLAYGRVNALEPIRKWENRLQTRPFGQVFRFLSTHARYSP